MAPRMANADSLAGEVGILKIPSVGDFVRVEFTSVKLGEQVHFDAGLLALVDELATSATRAPYALATLRGYVLGRSGVLR